MRNVGVPALLLQAPCQMRRECLTRRDRATYIWHCLNGRRIEFRRWDKNVPNSQLVADKYVVEAQKLARYWATDYDWRKCEAKLNALPQFITTIDGLDIPLHSRSVEECESVAGHHHARLARFDY